MREFHVYLLDASGHITSREDLALDSLEEAISRGFEALTRKNSESLRPGVAIAIEAWSGAKKLYFGKPA